MSNDIIKEITPTQAWEIMGSDPSAVLLDVRSRFEYEYVGHPEPSINVPWQEVPDWSTDPQFVEKVRSRLSAFKGNNAPPESRTLLMLCRSGKRSMAAAIRLAENGFTNVTNVAEGFEGDLDGNGHRGMRNGWRFHGLPWRQG